MRLNAYLARAGKTSRRGADGLIKAGRVKVNNQMGSLNTQVNSNDVVELDGKTLKAQTLRYILINKPPKVVTTLKDPEGRRTILNLLSISERVVPVGRLDFGTTGALLLTNDGPLAYQLMHPSFEVSKVYEADVKGDITPEKLTVLGRGVKLEDGVSAPAKAQKINASRIELTIHEGRKHQVKRMLAALGLEVKSLHRSSYAGLTVNDLPSGKWRELSQTEVEALKKQIGLLQ